MGFNFTVGSQPISVSALGYYAPYLPAGTSHQVAIFNDANKTLVGTVSTITSTGTTTSGTWIYNSVTPFTLSANTTYDAMASNVSGTATTTGNASYLVVANSPTYGTDLTFNIMVFTSASNSATVQAPNSTFAANNPGAFNADFQYTITPEPASVGLLGLGAAGFLVRRRRRSLPDEK